MGSTNSWARMCSTWSRCLAHGSGKRARDDRVDKTKAASATKPASANPWVQEQADAERRELPSCNGWSGSLVSPSASPRTPSCVSTIILAKTTPADAVKDALPASTPSLRRSFPSGAVVPLTWSPLTAHTRTAALVAPKFTAVGTMSFVHHT